MKQLIPIDFLSWRLIIPATILLLAGSCKKYLNETPNKSYAIPEKLSDYQSLLDYYPNMNNKDVSSGEISATDYYMTDANYASLSTDYLKRMYTWEQANLFAPASNEWSAAYQAIYVSNTVLNGLTKIPSSNNLTEWNNIKGQALVFRAKNFLQIVSVWASAYDSGSAGSLGIPLRLNTNFEEASMRADLASTYQQVLNDLNQAIPILPVTPVSVLRPSRAAAYGLLARTHLFMGNYEKSGLYADSCLQLKSDLISYSDLAANAAFPFKRFNAEVIFDTNMPNAAPLAQSKALIDPLLYQQYDLNDLRRTLFFKNNAGGTFSFRGSYEGSASLFSGVATDEMYLIRAESFARSGKVKEAISDLNILLKSRWKGSYTDVSTTNGPTALALILTERRKELLMRGLRWPDIKRLNKEGGNIILKRSVNGISLLLTPNDLRYSLPIPEDVIQNSGMTQNPR
jgi:hypothetical protein